MQCVITAKSRTVSVRHPYFCRYIHSILRHSIQDSLAPDLGDTISANNSIAVGWKPKATDPGPMVSVL